MLVKTTYGESFPLHLPQEKIWQELVDLKYSRKHSASRIAVKFDYKFNTWAERAFWINNRPANKKKRRQNETWRQSFNLIETHLISSNEAKELY